MDVLRGAYRTLGTMQARVCTHVVLWTLQFHNADSGELPRLFEAVAPAGLGAIVDDVEVEVHVGAHLVLLRRLLRLLVPLRTMAPGQGQGQPWASLHARVMVMSGVEIDDIE